MFGQIARHLGKVGRRANVARQIAKVAREADTVRDGEALLQTGGGKALGCCIVNAEGDAAQRQLRFFRLAFHLLKAVSGGA